MEKKPQISISDSTSAFPPATAVTANVTATDTVVDKNAEWKQRKAQQAAVRKLERELAKCEERIAFIEDRTSKIDEEMAKPEICSNSVKLQELQKEKDSLEEEMMTLMERWEEISEELS